MSRIPLLLVALFSLAWNGSFAYTLSAWGHPAMALVFALVFAVCMVRWLKACWQAMR